MIEEKDKDLMPNNNEETKLEVSEEKLDTHTEIIEPVQETSQDIELIEEDPNDSKKVPIVPIIIMSVIVLLMIICVIVILTTGGPIDGSTPSK